MEAMEAMEGGVASRANTVIALLECGVVASCDADAQDTRACDADHEGMNMRRSGGRKEKSDEKV